MEGGSELTAVAESDANGETIPDAPRGERHRVPPLSPSQAGHMRELAKTEERREREERERRDCTTNPTPETDVLSNSFN